MRDIDKLAKEAANAIGVTPYSDMRLFVEQAVKYALEKEFKKDEELRSLAKEFQQRVSEYISETTFDADGGLAECDAKLYVLVNE